MPRVKVISAVPRASTSWRRFFRVSSLFVSRGAGLEIYRVEACVPFPRQEQVVKPHVHGAIQTSIRWI